MKLFLALLLLPISINAQAIISGGNVGGGSISSGGGIRNLNGTVVTAKCQNPVAAMAFSYNVNAPAALCESDNIQAYLNFTASTAQTVYERFVLPIDWTGSLKLVLSFYSASTDAAAANVYLSCISTGAVASPTFGTAQAITLNPTATRTNLTTTLITDAAKANKACAAGDMLIWKLTITAAAAADLKLLTLQFTE